MFSIQDIIELAIQIERNGENTCRQALKKNIDPALADLFKWMAEEELKHIEWFKRLDKINQTSIQDSQLEKMGRALLSDILGDQGFSLSDADLTQIHQLDKLVSLLIEFENDTVLFYEMIRSVVSDQEALKYLDMIIEEENQHAKRLRKYIESKIAFNDR